MKTIVVGAVGSTKDLLETMIKLNFPISMVFSLDEKYSENVSGYFPNHNIAISNNIPYKKFKNINDNENIEIIEKIAPDLIFVVGLSQLVKQPVLNCAKLGVVGFHPTPLPKFRGRAAIVWQILLGITKTKCTLFLINEGMDSGDILGQEDYEISSDDYAEDVHRKCGKAAIKLFERVLKDLMDGNMRTIEQDEKQATYLLKRNPEDGLINWENTGKEIHTLIRAVSRPYPGAFSNYDDNMKVIFWRANLEDNTKYIGIPGQIANVSQSYFEVICKDGLLKVYDYTIIGDKNLVVGHKFR